MRLKDFDQEYDLTNLVHKPLHFGLFANVIIPAGLLFACFWYDQNYHPTSRISGSGQTLFYVFAAISLLQAAGALWWREKKFREPMVRREETFEVDLAHRVLHYSKPIFLLIASISIWGYIFFFLTAQIEGAIILVAGSFLVFQIVRPRYGSMNRLVAYQERLVKEGKFRKGAGLLE